MGLRLCLDGFKLLIGQWYQLTMKMKRKGQELVPVADQLILVTTVPDRQGVLLHSGRSGWTLVTRGKLLRHGHHQPSVPQDLDDVDEQ